jgi:alpha-ketoglutarate-dependent taurine dioxygenase
MDEIRTRWLNDPTPGNAINTTGQRTTSHHPASLTASVPVQDKGSLPDAVSTRQRAAVCTDHSAAPHAPELMDEATWQYWRTRKLARSRNPARNPEGDSTGDATGDPVQNSVVHLADPVAPSAGEIARLTDLVGNNGFAIYQFPAQWSRPDVDQDNALGSLLLSFCRTLGLGRPLHNPAADSGGISRIEAVPASSVMGPRDRTRYIPYSRKELNWHTDGYYNPDHRRVGAFLLHCVRDAKAGGVNHLMDGEMLYLLLRDHSPRMARALCHPRALTIPGDTGAEGSGRETLCGPVFSQDPETGSIQVRYTQRRHNIHWRQDADTLAAVAFIRTLLQEGHEAIHSWRLSPGQGILCNNVLHCRTAFTDRPGAGNGRLLYRLRFHQGVSHRRKHA